MYPVDPYEGTVTHALHLCPSPVFMSILTPLPRPLVGGACSRWELLDVSSYLYLRTGGHYLDIGREYRV